MSRYSTIHSALPKPLSEFYSNTKAFPSVERCAELKKRVELSLSNKQYEQAIMWLSDYALYPEADANYCNETFKGLSEGYADLYQHRGFQLFAQPAHSNQPMRVADLKNRFAGQRAFIIGNGPSLNLLDLSLLKDEITFGVNSLFYKFDEMGFTPTFFTIEDTFVAEDRSVEIGLVQGPIKFYGNYLDEFLATDPESIWLNVIPNYAEYSGFPHFSTDAPSRLWVGGTVTYINLQLAYYMGFSEIYMIGFDHSYVIPKDATTKGANIISNSDDPNHFHPDYFGKGYRWHDPRVDRMERCFIQARHAFELDGRHIYNATAGGKLEVFERKDYSESLKSGRPAMVDNKLGTDWVRQHKQNLLQERFNSLSLGDTEPELSVIVPAYNVEKYLKRCLESISSQSHQSLEIIVIDDGSTDRTSEVIEQFLQYDPRARCITQANSGLSAARNAGIDSAKGRYITFVDSDDWLESRMFEEMLALMKRGGLDIVNCSAQRVDERKRADGKPIHGIHVAPGSSVIAFLCAEVPNVACGRIYKTALFTDNNIKFPVNILHEDISTVFKLYFFAEKVGSLAKPYYRWLTRQDSISNQNITEKFIDDLFEILRIREDFLREVPERWNIFKSYFYIGSWQLIDAFAKRVHFLNDEQKKKQLLKMIHGKILAYGLDSDDIYAFVTERHPALLRAAWFRILHLPKQCFAGQIGGDECVEGSYAKCRRILGNIRREPRLIKHYCNRAREIFFK